MPVEHFFYFTSNCDHEEIQFKDATDLWRKKELRELQNNGTDDLLNILIFFKLNYISHDIPLRVEARWK